MRTWRTKTAALLRQWRVAREQRRQAARAHQDQLGADELDRARSGVDRFPPSGGM
ncbi:hypothetical protein [Nocardioides sp.]|jgi:hypothetical protein|uniref:hypothetical protein n=1 Tax=Nocardioides sp. TaxID=35761 RepID=UPI002F3F6AC7